MVLKAKHLYKIDFVEKERYKDYVPYKGYCIVCPCSDLEYHRENKQMYQVLCSYRCFWQI